MKRWSVYMEGCRFGACFDLQSDTPHFYPATYQTAGDVLADIMGRERKRRIKLAVWAYAYELMAHSVVDDGTFDRECLKVDLTQSTGNAVLDAWWRENFKPWTGMWVHNHPGRDRLHQIVTGMMRGAHG